MRICGKAQILICRNYIAIICIFLAIKYLRDHNDRKMNRRRKEVREKGFS